MATTKKTEAVETTCPKCGATVLRAGQKFLVLDKTLWQCAACGHPFNYPPLPRKAKRK